MSNSPKRYSAVFSSQLIAPIQPLKSVWGQMFYIPFESNVTVYTQNCLDLLEQKRQCIVAELFGNESFNKYMTSMNYNPENVDQVASLRPDDDLFKNKPRIGGGHFINLVYEIRVIVQLRNAVEARKMNEDEFASQMIIDACGRLDIDIPTTAKNISSLIRNAKWFYETNDNDKNAQDLSIDGSLREYVHIGDLFKQQPTKRHEEFIAIIEDIIRIPNIKDLKDTDFNAEFPYVVITAPSGTGKTQLPFSIAKYPVLYFTTIETANSSTAQPIYMNFQRLSKHLHEAVMSDTKKFESEPEIVFSIETIQHQFRENIRYRTLGFLIGLLKTILAEAKTRDPNAGTGRDKNVIMPKNWLLAEIECSQFEYENLSIGQARKKLKEIFCTKHPVVLIFLDEVNHMFEPAFKLLLSLIRSMELVAVTMGTNVNAQNFVRQSNYTGSRVCSDPWCYLVHRLPPACPAYIEQKRNQVASLKPPQQLRKFVKLLFKLMATERPLFVVKACNEMIDAFSNNPVSTDIELLERIVGKIFTEFVQVNGVEIDDDFYKGQVDFLDPRPRQARSASFINKHVAYFDGRVVEIKVISRYNPFDINFVHQDNGKIFFKFVHSDEPNSKICIIKDSYHFVYLDMKSVMPEFDKEPITGLCFTGAFPVLDQFFLTKEKKPASCLKKYSELFSPLPLHDHDSRASLNGMYLEKVAAMSLILASHSVSIGDALNFEEFFMQFIRELQNNYDHKPNIKCEKDDMKLWEQFSKIRIPYCGSISAKWNKELFDHLTKSKCLLGTVQENKADEGVNVVMYRGNNESEPLISVECRLHSANSDISQIGTKWDSLTQREGESNNPRKRTIEDKIKDLGQALAKEPSIPPINIMLVRRLTDATNFEKMAKCLEDQRIWLVRLVKADSGCNSDYLLQSQYRANKIKRIYIMMDLDTTAPNTNPKSSNHARTKLLSIYQ